MGGQNNQYMADYVTARRLYRQYINAADSPADPTNAAVPVLNTAIAANLNMGLAPNACSKYGRNAQLDVAVIKSGTGKLTLDLWLLANVQGKDVTPAVPPVPPESSSSSSDSYPCTGKYEDWVLVESKDFTVSALWVVKDIPPGLYKIVASTVPNGECVKLLEQHAA